MASTYTANLGLTLPTTGELSGVWGETVNTGITALLDSAIAGTTTLSADADVTLSVTDGAANQARSAVILWTATNGANTRSVTVPSHTKAYIVINAGTGSVIIKGAATTGVTIATGVKALIAWNGSDFVRISSSAVALSDISGLGANVGTFLATPSSANLAAALTDETGSGAAVFGTTPTIATPVINGTATGTGVATAATANTLVMRGASGEITGGAITGTTGTFSDAILGTYTNKVGAAVSARYNASNMRLGFNVANSSGYAYLALNANSTTSSNTATYDISNVAAKLTMNGEYVFSVAASGTAGNNITWTDAATITSTGLNSTVIGATTPAAGSFTTGTFSGGSSGTLSSTVTGDHGLILTTASTATKAAGLTMVANGSSAYLAYEGSTPAFGGTAGSLVAYVAGAARTVTSSTGLAVIGALSATSIAHAISQTPAGLTIQSGGGFYSHFKLGSDSGGTPYSLIDQPNTYGWIQFNVAGSERARLNSTGLAVTNLLDLSGAAAGQIKFPATQNASSDANTLDDYEEGTWTPVLRDGISGNAATAATTTGTYTRVGREVSFCMTLINVNASGLTAGNGVIITGLPFANNNITNNYVPFTVRTNSVALLTGAVVALIIENVTWMELDNFATGGTTPPILVSDITSGNGDVSIAGTYFTAT